MEAWGKRAKRENVEAAGLLRVLASNLGQSSFRCKPRKKNLLLSMGALTTTSLAASALASAAIATTTVTDAVTSTTLAAAAISATITTTTITAPTLSAAPNARA